MRAFVLSESGPALKTIDQPKPGPNDVLVRVRANALNRADLGMAQGHMHGGAGGLGAVLGMEWAGEVAEIGADVQGLKPGDRVMGSGAGAFAEFALADRGRVLTIPDSNLSFEQAACLPVALQTMHDAIVTNGRLVAGESVLIQGASSGVGLMGMQISKAMGAKLVIGTSTNAARRARLGEYGADLAVDSSDPDWVKQVTEATGGSGVDLIIDQISGPTMNQNMRAAKVLGRIVNVGRLGGMRGEFDFDLHAMRRIAYIGVTFRTRSKAEVREITRKMQADLAGPLGAGKLGLPIDKIFAFADLPDALVRMRANEHFGKIVVRH
jgi:NADPH:quinone reductase